MAQLGEHLAGSQGVRGSNPLTSTNARGRVKNRPLLFFYILFFAS